MNNDSCWIASPDVVLRQEMDDWALLFEPSTGQVVGVNPVGVEVWKLLDGSHSLDEIVSELKNKFTGVPDNLNDEVQAFFKSLIERGFIGKVTGKN